MDKESIFELQKIDCNCNDCKFMVRDIEKFKTSLELHHKWQLDYFTTIKNKLIEKALKWKKLKNDLENWDALMTEAEEMKFIFDKSEASLNYGTCSRYNKDVSFIPNTLQIDTQACFIHRREDTKKLPSNKVFFVLPDNKG